MRYTDMLSSGVKTVAPKGASLISRMLCSDRARSGESKRSRDREKQMRRAQREQRRPPSRESGSTGITRIAGKAGLLATTLGGLSHLVSSESDDRSKKDRSKKKDRSSQRSSWHTPSARTAASSLWSSRQESSSRSRSSRRDSRGQGTVSQILTASAATAIGAGMMYLLDPARGRRRRSVLRDQAVHAWHVAESGVRKTARDTASRARGFAAETKSRFRDENISDDQLRDRVRSAIGRAVSHPGSIHVDTSGGVVTLAGPILEHEVDSLLSTARKVRGVREIDNQLEPHSEPGSVPGLQGGPAVRRRGARPDMAQSSWSPTTRLSVGLVGGSLLSTALVRRDLLGLGLGAVGAALAVRSMTNLPTRRLVGIGAGRRAVDIQKTINIDAPVDRVFEFFSRYENFPHFMSRVREVRETGGDRSHWVVSGPAGISVEWDAEVTEFEPGQVLAWRSIEGSPIENAGMIRFHENDAGGTRVNVKLCYNPPGGALGHAAAVLFGADPKSEMDEDLMRMKVMIETGNPPHDAAQPVERREDAMPEMNIGPSRMPEPGTGQP